MQSVTERSDIGQSVVNSSAGFGMNFTGRAIGEMGATDPPFASICGYLRMVRLRALGDLGVNARFFSPPSTRIFTDNCQISIRVDPRHPR